MDSVRILSFDPGLTYAGWAIGVYQPADNHLKISDYGVLEPSKDLDRSIMKPMLEVCSKRILTLCAVEDMIGSLITDFQPDYVCSEDAFFNRFRPSAYAALLQWLTAVEMYLWRNYRITLYKFQQKVIKRAVARGDSGKLDVQKAIRNIPNLTFEESEQYRLKEHSADAIACNWTFCQHVLSDQHLP